MKIGDIKFFKCYKHSSLTGRIGNPDKNKVAGNSTNLFFHFQQKELMEAGRKQLEQLVQMNFLQHQAQQHLSQHPEIGKTLLEQMSQENFNNSNQSQNVIFIFLKDDKS